MCNWLFTINIGYLRMASKVPTAIGQVIEGKNISVTICHECLDVSNYFYALSIHLYLFLWRLQKSLSHFLIFPYQCQMKSFLEWVDWHIVHVCTSVEVKAPTRMFTYICTYDIHIIYMHIYCGVWLLSAHLPVKHICLTKINNIITKFIKNVQVRLVNKLNGLEIKQTLKSIQN